MAGTVLAVCISEKAGTRKKPVPRAEFVPDFGIMGDAHARNWHRQVSLLADEDAQTMRDLGAKVGPGDFAENLLLRGIDVAGIPVGRRVRIGPDVVLEITQIGKECHSDCEIARLTGTCVMPKKGIFAVVVSGGTVKPGDGAEVIENG